MLDTIVQDMRYAVRALRRSPGFTRTAIATLAIGIGVNAAVFTVTTAVLFKGFRLVERKDRVLYIDIRERELGCCVSYPDFEVWRAQAASFADIGTVADLRITLSDNSGFPESYTASLVTANAFRLLGTRLMPGRDFLPSDRLGVARPSFSAGAASALVAAPFHLRSRVPWSQFVVAIRSFGNAPLPD